MNLEPTCRVTRKQAYDFALAQLKNQNILNKVSCRKKIVVGSRGGTKVVDSNKDYAVHYGKCELQELLDQIYGEDAEGNAVDLIEYNLSEI